MTFYEFVKREHCRQGFGPNGAGVRNIILFCCLYYPLYYNAFLPYFVVSVYDLSEDSVSISVKFD